MKYLLTLFFLLFTYSLNSEEISNFELEGFSIGDSLLDFYSKEEILDNIEKDNSILHKKK